MLRSLLLSLALATGTAHATGPDGALDSSFGFSGQAKAAFTGEAIPGGMVSTPAGSTYVVGTRRPSDTETALLVSRFVTATGLPDATFGDGGSGAKVTQLPAGLRRPSVFAVTRQANGQVLAAGTLDDGTAVRPAFVCRFFAAGNLDAGFAANGCRTIRTFLPGEESCHSRGVTVDASGRIVIAGYCLGTFDSRPFLARLTATGAYDVSFFGGVFTPVIDEEGYAGRQYFQSVVMTPAGKIAVALSARHVNGDVDAGIAQFNDNGTFDTSFAGNGQRLIAFDLGPTVSTRGDFADELLVRPDGRLLVIARSAYNLLDGKLTMASVRPDGGDDTSFGVNGLRVDHAPLREAFVGVDALVYRNIRGAIDRFGRVLVAAYQRGDQGESDDVVRRYRADGSTDPSFGTNGSVSIDHQAAMGGPGRTSDYTVGVSLSAGRVIVASSARRANDNDDAMVIYALEDGDIFRDGFE